MATILIAENVTDIRNALTLLFERAGHDVVTATDGPTALDLAQARAPDLVILNRQLPLLDGLDVCRALRADPQTGSVKIVALGVRSHPEDVRAGLDAGADHYFGKPYRNHDILAEADRLLAHG